MNFLILVLITDTFVPSRAFASLPASYLYFETMNGSGSNTQRKFYGDLWLTNSS